MPKIKGDRRSQDPRSPFYVRRGDCLSTPPLVPLSFGEDKGGERRGRGGNGETLTTLKNRPDFDYKASLMVK